MIPINVPVAIVPTTRSSIQFIPKKPPFRGKLISATTWCVLRAVVD